LIDTLFLGDGGIDETYKSTYYYVDYLYLGHCDSMPFDTGVGIRESELIGRNHRFYPNPASNQINLAFEVKPNEQFSFLLYDLQGRLVKGQQLWEGNQHQIQLENLGRGFYLYQIRNGQGEFLRGKLVVN
tara:strand:- start:4039 stop:4428 length:390 start_codon:yes stop_codon:yes gene_type:complete